MKRTAEEYRRCALAGLSKSETARALGVSVQCVDDLAVRHGLSFRDGRKARALLHNRTDLGDLSPSLSVSYAKFGSV